MVYHVYSIPFKPILKVFFLHLKKFFTEICTFFPGCRNHFPQTHPSVRQKSKERQRQPAQCEEVSTASHEKPDPLIDADFPVSPKDGKEKQGNGGGEPEAEIQHSRPPSTRLPLPHNPQSVIHHAQSRAHDHSLQKVDPLGCHIHSHQRSSRASSDPLFSRRSSS